MNVDFEKGFTKIYHNNTFNKNDKDGVICLVNITIIIIALITAFLMRNSLSFVTFVIILILVNMYYYSRPSNQIHLLYAFSYIISSNVRTEEFLDLQENFGNYVKFEDKYEIIKDEVMGFINKEGVKNVPLTRDSYGGENEKIGSDVKIDEKGQESGWRLITLKAGDEITSKCSDNFPSLAKVLKDVPEVVSCVLSILEPGIMIPIHVGYYKGILRYMLPLSVPDDRENCFLWVNGLKYSWMNGKSVLWDDTYPHKVYNNTNQTRVLLYMDIIRPMNGFLKNMNMFVLNLMQNSQVVKDEIKRTEQKIKI